jgi:hypothetical protein
MNCVKSEQRQGKRRRCSKLTHAMKCSLFAAGGLGNIGVIFAECLLRNRQPVHMRRLRGWVERTRTRKRHFGKVVEMLGKFTA